MPRIIQTTQNRLTRILTRLGRGIDQRDVWSTRDYYANRWSAGDTHRRGF
jgi:hypothetical protein